MKVETMDFEKTLKIGTEFDIIENNNKSNAMDFEKIIEHMNLI